jgi:hypothetical protein
MRDFRTYTNLEPLDFVRIHQADLAKLTRAHKALVLIRDSFWSENEPCQERIDCLQSMAEEALEDLK